MSLDFYQKNADKYVQESLTFDMSPFYRFCDSVILNNNVQTILDLGFGSGRDMARFNSMGLLTSGIDGCDEFVELGKKNRLNVFKEVLPDIQSTYPTYDLIYSVGVLFHLPKEEHQKVLDWIKDHLNPGGFFIISYNELNRENDKERFFVTLKKEELDIQVGLPIFKEELMTDKRGIEWITTAYQK